MRFICDKCKAKYSIADEKIKKKVLKIRCKKCSHVIIVRDTRQQAASSMSSLSAASPLRASTVSSSQHQNAQSNPFQPQQRPQQQQRPAPQAASLGPAHDEESDVGERTVVARISSEWFNQIREEKKEEPIWFVASQGQPVGPIVLSDVHARIRNRELGRDELVWCAGWPDWVPANTVTDLLPVFQSLTATPPPPPPVRAPAVPPPAPPAPAPRPAQPAQAQPFQAQQPAQAKPQQAQAQPFQAQPANGIGTPVGFDDMDFATVPANGKHSPQPAENKAKSSHLNDLDFATKPGNPFDLHKPSPDLGAPKPAAKPAPSNPFGPASTGAAPAKDSPLAMLANPAPAPAPAAPKPAPVSPSSTPWDAKPQGQALQTATPSKHQTPADVLAAAPAPQPALKELTTGPGPAPVAPAPDGKDIAHVQQARPAVELIEVGAEEDFFKNADARKTNDDDLFEVALPPLPNWEQDAHEIDVDDIIEIQDAIKPRWGLRLAIILGLVVGIGGFVIAISWFMGGFKDPVRIAAANGQDGDNKSENGTQVTPRKVSKVGGALLGQGTPDPKKPKKLKKARKRWRPRNTNRRRPVNRRTIRLAKAPKVRGGSGGGDADINKLIYQAYKRKIGGGSGNSGGGGVKGKIQGGDKLSPSLEKRIYKEIARNRGQVKYCYEQYLKKAYLSGRLTIKIRIEQSGQVSQVRITSRKLRRLQVSQCIARKMKRWKFASFRGTPYIDTEIPYLLRAQ